MARLTLVPTPIGNLEDISLRALKLLREADVVAAEDTRHSGKLLAHFQIDKKLERLDAHTILERGERVLANYERVAFITDAGTPGISDPGTDLIQMALKRGDTVEVLPGATALIPALVLSGLPLSRFGFEGFLPRKGKARRERLEVIAGSDRTLALYESPHRLLATLKDLAEVCGPERQASVSREISKLYEETVRGSLAELITRFEGQNVKGEIVLVIAPAPPTEETGDLSLRARQLAAEGLSGKTLRKALMALGASRNVAYELSLMEGETESETSADSSQCL